MLEYGADCARIMCADCARILPYCHDYARTLQFGKHPRRVIYINIATHIHPSTLAPGSSLNFNAYETDSYPL